MEDRARREQVRNARSAVAWAVLTGKLRRAERCQVCNVVTGEIGSREWHTADRFRRTVAHHWRGYEYKLDVWWVCYSCNRKLWNRHDGSLTLEQARVFVETKTYGWFYPGFPGPHWYDLLA